ncbi:MAG: Vitamin epoxide reductase [Gemmatimonadetes bacterium]|nr:Vitamin epoxide reductase [Gemmatimonadota bacterium]
MNRRMLTALIALLGLFVALYLTLYKLGYIGQLVCAVGSCEKVQTSRWATLFGLPVALWGVGFYVAVLLLSIMRLQPPLDESAAIRKALLAITGFGVIFSGWLTWLEAYRIEAWCQWCVISAILTLILFLLCVTDAEQPGTVPAS